MGKLWVENITNYPNVQYTDEDLSATHTDDSNNIEKWDEYGLEVLQWLHVRRKLTPLIYAAATNIDPFDNWGGLTQAIRDIAIKWICAPYVLRVPAITDTEDRENWEVLMKQSRGVGEKCSGGRAFIIELMRERAADNLRTEIWDYNTSNQFYYDTAAHIEAYTFANTNDLIYWISNEAGTPYENNGFAQTSYYSVIIKNDLINIYNGFY